MEKMGVLQMLQTMLFICMGYLSGSVLYALIIIPERRTPLCSVDSGAVYLRCCSICSNDSSRYISLCIMEMQLKLTLLWRLSLSPRRSSGNAAQSLHAVQRGTGRKDQQLLYKAGSKSADCIWSGLQCRTVIQTSACSLSRVLSQW